LAGKTVRQVEEFRSAAFENAGVIVVQPAKQLEVGQTVIVSCSDEGYSGKTGTIVAVFPSGRCQVAVGPIAVLNLPPEGIELKC
jgi:hypothetical protein